MGGPGSGAKPRQYPPEIVKLACELYEIGMTVTEIRAVFLKGYRVQTIWNGTSPERRPCIKRNQRGPANDSWRGDTPGYAAAHLRIASTYGKASGHFCADCGDTAATGRSATNATPPSTSDRGLVYCTHLEHYAPRCIPCHFRFDYRGHRANGHALLARR